MSDDDEYLDDENDQDFDINEYRSTEGSDDSNDFENDNENYDLDDDEEKGGDYFEDESKYPSPTSPNGHRFDKKFVCIRYPGNVINPDKAVETLGGLAAISTVVNTPNRRLELRFRPSDTYCKPACGDRHEMTGFLLRIRTKKSRVQAINQASLQKQHLEFRKLEPVPLPSNPELRKTLEDLENQIKNCSVDPIINHQERRSTLEDKKTEKTGFPYGKRPLPDDILPTFDKNKYEDLSNDVHYELPKLKILGRIETEYKFTNLCDFQFLPVLKNQNTSKNECIYNEIYPSGIPSYKWLQKDVPHFLPPAVFSRMDSVQNYSLKTESKETGPENIIGKTRKRRGGYSNKISFGTENVPTEPPVGIENAMKLKFLGQSHLEKIRKLFEERPIWSRNALLFKTKFSREQIKLILPCVAYYYTNGPWRMMWVKLGEDPRNNPALRIYQTLDYRRKHMHGLEQSIKGKKRSPNNILRYKSTTVTKSKIASVLTHMGEEDETDTNKRRNEMKEDIYIYREGIVPPSKQMFYQYCDVFAEDIQSMLAKLPDPQPGTKCDEKHGWLPVGFSDQCREIINKHVRVVLRKRSNIPVDYPTRLPRKRPIGKSVNVKRTRVTRKRKESSESEWEDM
ncbi:hypothetical protein HCN44_000358 [Aphidius gifuensis]|uniref:General transcription factor 3C polypeptide 5 n=1 Tax=Aphidius gifuensis TaxID=684658 RepID=A0A834XNG4_APHGI|nr:general transcription factor 3C polypeptide 5 [Aphidius gifuensis]KAF7990553.1 hypothetical protein HCN44_000358 [Aphidius gifuensis]